MNSKLITSFVLTVALYMGLLAIMRYVFEGTLENWVWWRSLILAVGVAVFNVYRNNKRGAYQDHPGNG